MIIAIIGLPNVGKSTLFNKFIGRKQSLETAIAGTTRDQNRAYFFWEGVEFELIDTPGLKSISSQTKDENTDDENILESNIQLQAKRALEEADTIIYMIDFKTGPLSQDLEVIKKLRRSQQKKIILTVNKADKTFEQLEAAKFIKLGLGEPMAVSAKNGRGTSDLLDLLVKQSRKMKMKSVSKESETSSSSIINLSIIGKPNSGKSSLFNALLKQEKVVVSPIPHTTRDSNTTEIIYNNYTFNLIDTAGLRKKARIYTAKKNVIEIFSIKQTLSMIKKSDIALLMIDAAEQTTVQDLKISKLITDNACGLIILANKWDKIPEKETNLLARYRQYLYGRFKSLNWAPLIFTDVKSASKGKIYGLDERYLNSDQKNSESVPVNKSNPMYKLLDLVIQIRHNQTKQIPDDELKEHFAQALKKQPPPKPKGRTPRTKILRFDQVLADKPTFYLELPAKARLPQHYLGYLKRSLRDRFGFWGTTITIKCQNRKTKR